MSKASECQLCGHWIRKGVYHCQPCKAFLTWISKQLDAKMLP